MLFSELQNLPYHRTAVPLTGCDVCVFFTPPAVGATVAGSAHAGAVLRGAGAAVLAGAAVGAVGPPAALLTHTVTVDACMTNTHTDTHTELDNITNTCIYFVTT